MSLDVKFKATDSGFTSTVSKVKGSVKSMDDSVAKTATSVKTSFGSMVKAGAALAIGFGAIKVAANAIAGTFATFKEALDLGGELNDLSSRTGETAGNLMILRRAFDNAGAGADKVGPAVNRMQKFMEESQQGIKLNIDTLNRLGLSYDSLKGKTPTEQMQMLAKAISEMPDPAQRATAAMQVFGRSGAELLPLFNNFSNEIARANGQLGDMPGVMDRANEQFDAISDNLLVAKGKAVEFAAGFLEQVAPAIELVTHLLANFNAAGAGMKLGEILTGASNAMGGFNDALSAIKLGEFGLAFKITFESIKLQIADSINSIAANVMAAIKATSTFLMTAFGPGSGIFTMIGAQFEILSAKFTKSMIGGAKEIAEALNIPFASFDGALKNADRNITQAQNKISNSIGQIAGDFVLAGQEAGKAFDDTLKTSKQLIDTSSIEVKLQQHRVDLKRLEVEELAAAAKTAAEKLTIEEQSIKTAQDRITHEERVKELDADIASAKRQGNKEEVAALEAMKAFHVELQASKEKGLSLDEAHNNANKARQNIIDGVIEKNQKELATKKEITKELEKQLGLGEKIQADANAAQRKDRLDKGGRLEKEAGEAIGQGNFARARRIGRQIEKREMQQQFEDAFGKGDVSKMAKEAGIDTFGKTTRQLKDELMKKRQEEMKPGAEGKKGDKPGEAAKDPKIEQGNLLQKSVDAIQKAVESLEKKLPMPALGV